MKGIYSLIPLLLLSLSKSLVSAQQQYDDLGQWGDRFDTKVIPIHSMLLPDGKILMYGTDNKGRQGGAIYYEVWDPRSGDHGDSGNHELLQHKTNVDLFCTTLSIDPSTGNVLIMGGDDRPGGHTNYGIRDALEFNTKTHEIRNHPKGDMKYGRWYGTSVNLPDGRIFVAGGRGEYKYGKAGSPIPEVWSPDNGFRELPGAKIQAIIDQKGGTWWYPPVYVNSDGDVIVFMSENSDIYHVGLDGTGSIDRVAKRPFSTQQLNPSIMYDKDKVVWLARDGWLWSIDISNSRDIKFSRRVDIGPTRTNGAMSLMPDGRVAITGGCSDPDDNGNTEENAVRNIQIWDPRNDDVFSGPRERTARLYHSSALILPDGSVFSGGGGAPGPLKNLNGQVFYPGYLFASTRPEIVAWPHLIRAGDSFTITVDDIGAVDRVTITKPGALTHGHNCDSRWLNLSFQKQGDSILVDTPNRNVMIPGVWVLTTIDKSGVPSEGRIMGVNMYDNGSIDRGGSPNNGATPKPNFEPTPEPRPQPTLEPRPNNMPIIPQLSLKDIGNNGLANDGDPTAYPLGQCEGDCDSDNECADGLYCYNTDGPTTVPGCNGVRRVTGNGRQDDYCTAYT